LDTFLLKLFDKYSELLKTHFKRDFLAVRIPQSSKTEGAPPGLTKNAKIMQNDDYMPMTVNNLAEYDEIMDIVWYKEDRDRLAIT